MSDDQNSKGRMIAIFALLSVVIGIPLLLALGTGLKAIFNPDSRVLFGGSSLFKKFRKNIGLCCLLFGIAIAVPLTQLVKINLKF